MPTVDPVPSARLAARLARPNELVVSLDAVRRNVAVLRAAIGPRTALFAALKADAYGFGLVPVGRTVDRAGADGVGVSDLADAHTLRGAGFRGRILLYAGTLPDADVVGEMHRLRVLPTVTCTADAEALDRWADPGLPVLIKVDVGLARLGVPVAMAPQLVERVRSLPRLHLAGIYTHMHSAAGPHPLRHAQVQFDRFTAALAGMPGIFRMAASTFAMQMTDAMTLDAVDPGHLVFGMHLPAPTGALPELAPAFVELTSRLVQVRHVDVGELLDPPPFPAAGVTRIGVLPIGAADGFHLVNAGHVLIRGRAVAVLGDPSAEYVRVDLTGLDAETGDVATVIGRQGDAEITLEDVRAARGLRGVGQIPFSVAARVPRRYLPARGPEFPTPETRTAQ